MNKIDDFDINNLNSNIKHSEEELTKVRKKFLIMLSVFLTIIVAFILYFIFRNDIINFFNRDDETEQIEEVDSNELYQLEDGDVSIDNKEVVALYENFHIYYEDYFIINPLVIYTTSFNEMTNLEQLVLISKSSDFKNIIKSDNTYMNYEKLCNSEIEISSSTVELIAKNRFNISNIVHSSFWTTYTYNGAFLSYLYFKYDDGNYTGVCGDYEKTEIEVVSYNKLVKVTKSGGKLYLYINVFFENASGVYKDVSLTDIITDVYNYDDISSYYENGTTYKIEFVLNSDNDYYFNSITVSDDY